MRVFISAGEPSGDLHGANLIRELRCRCPGIEAVGFGGDRMAEAGGELLFPLTQLALMWYANAFKNLRTFYRVLDLADDCFRRRRPDAVVLIDYPGFNWNVARRAHAHGIPVYYFVPPQLWGWGGWRVRKMHRWVNHVLCSLPFEPEWYERRGVAAQYIGHPFFDELARQQCDEAFIGSERAKRGRIVVILPGSRNQEVSGNLPPFIDAARMVHARVPDVRFLVASFNEPQQEYAERAFAGSGLPVDVHVRRTPEIIRLAEVCMSVSGSVGLELLHQAVPSVVYYQVTRAQKFWIRLVMRSRWFSLINLLAGEEIAPEFLPARPEPAKIAEPLIRWLNDEPSLLAVRRKLEVVRDRVASPGACGRAADYILTTTAPAMRRAG